MKSNYELRKEGRTFLNSFGKTGPILVSFFSGVILGIINFIAIIISGPIFVTETSYYLKAFRENEKDIEKTFDDIPEFFVSAMITQLLKNVFVILWSLLLIIPGIVKSYSYALTSYIVADNHHVDGMEALERSKELMKGHKLRLFLLDLSFIGWHLLSILTLGVLRVLYVKPYVKATKTAFYLDLMKQPSFRAQYQKDEFAVDPSDYEIDFE